MLYELQSLENIPFSLCLRTFCNSLKQSNLSQFSQVDRHSKSVSAAGLCHLKKFRRSDEERMNRYLNFICEH